MITALFIVGLLLFGVLVIWLYTDNSTPQPKHGQLNHDKLNALTEQLQKVKAPAGHQANDLFAVQGRKNFAQVTETAGRQRRGPDLGPLPNGSGRVKNPNAPCWNCGQPRRTNHKCP